MNKRLRTRRDLLQAASRLLKAGKEPTMDDIAKEALVSRATAYRYFSDIDALLIEVGLDGSIPDAKAALKKCDGAGIVERVDQAERVMHDMVYKNEQQLRLMLSRSVMGQRTTAGSPEIPARQNRRGDYISEALSPFRDKFDSKTFKKLSESLALVFGPEAMIVYRDVVPLKADRAREVKSWIITALVEAALKESRGKKNR